MRSPIIAIVLCIVSATAVAQCVAQPPSAALTAAATATPVTITPARPGPDTKKAAPELIKTAGAVTHDAPVMRAAPSPAHSADAEPPRRTGSAMLLAALALMSGIALRRYSARDQ